MDKNTGNFKFLLFVTIIFTYQTVMLSDSEASQTIHNRSVGRGCFAIAQHDELCVNPATNTETTTTM